jgi:hypothetical protein
MNIFRNVMGSRPKLNKFDLSHEHKLSMDFGQLVPTFIQEVVPADRFRVQSEQMYRLAPTISPFMHRVNVFTHYWWVPNRIVFPMWDPYITGGETGTEEVASPTLGLNDSNKTRFVKGRLGDYFGLPVVNATDTIAQNVAVNALPFRAYAEIYNEYYRDQNLEAKIEYSKDPGAAPNADVEELTKIRQANYEKDYLTSALPWPQRGSDVMLPSDINYKDVSDVRQEGGQVPLDGPLSTASGFVIADSISSRIENIENLGVTINDLRTSVRLQEWLEKNARGGSRLAEVILQHFGVVSDDLRLARPKFLGGGRQPMTISEVLQTSGSPGVNEYTPTPQGNMSGHGISVGNTNAFKHKFKEHGWIIGITFVVPRTAYQQNIPRWVNRLDRLDYYWPSFAHLGEQEVTNGEVYYDHTDNSLDENGVKQHLQTFGYQSRYADYKFQMSKVSGDFRDNLSFWHAGRIFDSKPGLNEAFIKMNKDDVDRLFAVEGDVANRIYGQIYNSVSALRPMPYYGTPRL